MREARAMRVLPACSMAITFMVVSLPLVSSSSLLQERLAWKTVLGSGKEGRVGERERGRGGLERRQGDGRGKRRGRHKRGRMMMRIKEEQEGEVSLTERVECSLTVLEHDINPGFISGVQAKRGNGGVIQSKTARDGYRWG